MEQEVVKIRIKKAIDRFVSIFNGSYELIGEYDSYYKIFDSKRNLIAYADVVDISKNIKSIELFEVPIKSISKVSSKILNPTIIWSCDDGVVYGKINKLAGAIRFGANKQLNAYYSVQKEMKYIRY